MVDILRSGPFSYLLIILLFVIFSIAFIVPVSAETSVSISPSSQTMAVGSDVTVTIFIEQDTPISGAQFDLHFNNEVLSAESVSEGSIFTNGVTTLFNGGTIDNSNGGIMNVYSVLFGRHAVTDHGVMATIVFKAKTTGSSSLELSNVVVSNSSGAAVPISVTNGIVTVGVITSTDNTAISGGGGGGGGGATGEEFENIDFKDVAERNIILGQNISYEFDSLGNPIVNINFTGLKNSGNIQATIELLKNTSALVTAAPNGLVYKNLNIWVGKAGFATPGNIESLSIGFKVENSWINEHDIKSSDIRLLRYSDNAWSSLETTIVGVDGEYSYFKSVTPGFSPFAIIADIGVLEIHNTDDSDAGISSSESHVVDSSVTDAGGESTLAKEESNVPSERSLAQNTLIFSILSIFILAIRQSRD